MDLLAQRVADDFPRVRIEAMRALAEIPCARSAELVLGALDKPMDHFLDYAAWLSINDLAAAVGGGGEVRRVEIRRAREAIGICAESD